MSGVTDSAGKFQAVEECRPDETASALRAASAEHLDETRQTRLLQWTRPARQQAPWLLLLLSIKAALFLLGVMTCSVFNNRAPAGWERGLGIWNQWDVKDYLAIAAAGYRPDTPDAVRLPLLPTLIALVDNAQQWIGLHSVLLAGFVVATLASLPLAWLMFQLAKLDMRKAAADRATWFLLIFPMSFCLHLPLTEGLFTALVLGSFLAARKGRWYIAGSLGALACATRLNGVLLFPALAVEAAVQLRATGKWRREYLWLALIPLGIAPYLWINHATYGSALAFLEIQAHAYGRALDWPWVGIRKLFALTVTQNETSSMLVGFPQAASLFFALIVLVWSSCYSRLSYTVWIGLSLLLFTSTDYIESLPRLIIPLFPIYLFLAAITRRRPLFAAASFLSILLLGFYAALFSRGWWAF